MRDGGRNKKKAQDNAQNNMQRNEQKNMQDNAQNNMQVSAQNNMRVSARKKAQVNARRGLFAVFPVLWMIIIFAFSAAEGDESEQLSSRAGEMVCRIFVPGYGDMSPEEQKALAEKTDYPVRKLAHGVEYAVLGFLIAGAAVPDFKAFYRKRMFVSLLTGVVYACSDEFHQLFVPGRSGRVTDVLIDSAGILFGLFLFAVFTRFCGIRRE